MTIIGESEQGTIINGTGINWIFKITSGTNVTLCNLTLTNGFTSDSGGAILNRGNLNAKNCTFTDNIASNTNWGNYGWGGAICNREGSSSTITGCTFKNNSANTGGALSNSHMSSGSLKSIVTDCTFTGNSALLWGGAIENWGSDVDLTANYNRFYKNLAPEGSAIYNSIGSTDVESNWWGSNNPDSSFSSLIVGTSAPTEWLYMTINATPQTINNTQTSLITVSFNNRYNGTTVTPYIPGVGEYIPDGTSVTFSLIEDIFGPYGTLTGPLTVETNNGIASILFTASRVGVQEINASTDDENVTATVTINPSSYVEIEKEFRDLPWGSVITTAYYNDQIYAIVKVHNQGPDATSVSVLDILNGLTWTGNYYVVHAVGSYPLTQDSWILNDTSCPFNGTHWNIPSIPIMIGSEKWLAIECIINQSGTVSNYAETVDQSSYPYQGYDHYTAYITANKIPTNMTIVNARGNKDETVTLKAVLTDHLGNLLVGETVDFWIDGVKVGENTTDNTGTALFNYLITQTPGNHTLTVIFNETPAYVRCNATGTLYVPTADLYIQITSDKNNPRPGETFTLTYKLGNNGPDDAQKVTITIPIPEGFVISEIKGDGNWTINGNTITWTFNNVTVGDPYLYISGWTTRPGIYLFTASINSNTFNLNSRGINSLSINAEPQLNAATSNTVGMQNTGAPIAGIILAILMVLVGFIGARKKQ